MLMGYHCNLFEEINAHFVTALCILEFKVKYNKSK